MNDKKETRWIQLSDLHMFECTDVDLQKKALYKQFGAVTDFIVVTGDLHQYGKDYKQTIEFLEEINEKFNKIDKEDIIIVPGNHDASLTDKRKKAIEEVDAEIENNPDVYIQKLPNLYAGFNKYKIFLKEFYGDCGKREFLKDNVHIWKNKLAILCVNTALVSDREHFKPQIVDINGLSKLENPQLPCIAIMHHDYYGISDMHKPYVNGVFRALKVSAVLSGHKHRVGSTVIDIGNGEIIPNFCCAKSVSQPGDLWSDVGIIEYRWNEKENEIKIIPYMWDKINHVYIPTPKFENTDDFIVDNEGGVVFKKSFLLKNIDNVSEDFGTDSEGKKNQSEEKKEKLRNLSEISIIPKDLIQKIKEGNCVLFAGAGVSLDAGLPSWESLLRKLVECVDDCGILSDLQKKELDELLDNQDFTIVSEVCREKLGVFEYDKFIKECLNTDGKKSEMHTLLSQIPFKAAVTTNYDDFLEKTHPDNRVILPNELAGFAGEELKTIFKSESFPIFKIHGTSKESKEVVLTDCDYRKVIFEELEYRKKLKQLFQDKTLLFVGFSFRDPSVDLLLQELFTLSDGNIRPHYAFVNDIGEIKKEFYRKSRNIRVINYSTKDEGHIALKKMLEMIRDELK